MSKPIIYGRILPTSQETDFFKRKATDMAKICNMMIVDLMKGQVTVDSFEATYINMCSQFLHEAYEKGRSEAKS